MTINLEKTIKLSFISLATLPLLKENYNSIIIIVCGLLVILNLVHKKSLKSFNRNYWILTSLFWLFFIYECIAQSFNFDRILRYIPFLIFPLLFFYRPKYIDKNIRDFSINVFQFCVILQCIIYLIVFLRANPLNKLFYASLESIPFFREYVFTNYYFEIHPTYFSAFLLVSLSISLVRFLQYHKNQIIFHVLNAIFTLVFIFLFSSKVILILALFTILVVSILFIIRVNFKKTIVFITLLSLILIAIIYPSKTILIERFDEVRTEFNKPIVGTYYNSTNTRVAILKCSLILYKNSPYIGYGNELQNKLDDCYKATNKSDFYKISVFNTHNYYFNLILYGGWIFLIVFLIYLAFIFLKIRYSLLAIILFTQFLVINLTENFFSRHYGVVLFNYIICLFIFIPGANKEIKE